MMENESTKRPQVMLCVQSYTTGRLSPPPQLVLWFKLPLPLTGQLIDLASTFVSSKFLLNKVSKLILFKGLYKAILLLSSKLWSAPHFTYRESGSLYQGLPSPTLSVSITWSAKIAEEGSGKWSREVTGKYSRASLLQTHQPYSPLVILPHIRVALFWLVQVFAHM